MKPRPGATGKALEPFFAAALLVLLSFATGPLASSSWAGPGVELTQQEDDAASQSGAPAPDEIEPRAADPEVLSPDDTPGEGDDDGPGACPFLGRPLELMT